LKARYQNGKILVFAATAKIIDHKPIDGSSRQLRVLHDTIKSSISTLKNLDVSTKSWDPILCFLIRRKLGQQSLAALALNLQQHSAISQFTTKRAVRFVTYDNIILEHVAVPSKWTPKHGAKPLFM